MSDQYPTERPYSPPNSTMAIVSLIAGILGLTFVPTIGSIIAVITANMAKKEIRESRGALGGSGMATAGAVLGWIGIGLLVFSLCLVVFVFAAIALGLFSMDAFSALPALLAGM